MVRKLKRKYDARKSAFKSKSNNAEYEIISQTPDTADSYTNDLDYLRVIKNKLVKV